MKKVLIAVPALLLLGACTQQLAEEDRAMLQSALQASQQADASADRAEAAANRAEAAAERAEAAANKAERVFQKTMRK